MPPSWWTFDHAIAGGKEMEMTLISEKRDQVIKLGSLDVWLCNTAAL
jgi:hypothetical protein